MCPAWPNLPVSEPVTMMAELSRSLLMEAYVSSVLRRKCLIVKKVP